MFHVVKKIFAKNYQPLNRVEILADALESNYKTLQKHSNVSVAPVLKSNAYGHGIVEVARILDGVGAPFFCVDSIFEAYQLLDAKIKTPILIMGFVDPENLKTKRLPFSYAVYDKKTLWGILENQPHAKLHIFVDTGMHREGIVLENLSDLIADVPKTAIDGVMSHLAFAQEPHSPNTKKQIENFNQARAILNKHNIHPKWVHIGASAAAVRAREYGDIGNCVRCGIGLYGALEGDFQLTPTLSFITSVAQVKKIKKGDAIGYDCAYIAQSDMTIATLAAGYNDGVDRRLSKGGVVLIHNKACPIIGRVSMNIMTVDISAIENVVAGDRAIIYSHKKEDPNTICSATKQCETISYELLVHLHPSTKRIVR